MSEFMATKNFVGLKVWTTAEWSALQNGPAAVAALAALNAKVAAATLAAINTMCAAPKAAA
jgi:hypothetical protein